MKMAPGEVPFGVSCRRYLGEQMGHREVRELMPQARLERTGAVVSFRK
jgi:hypothetical protein